MFSDYGKRSLQYSEVLSGNLRTGKSDGISNGKRKNVRFCGKNRKDPEVFDDRKTIAFLGLYIEVQLVP